MMRNQRRQLNPLKPVESLKPKQLSPELRRVMTEHAYLELSISVEMDKLVPCSMELQELRKKKLKLNDRMQAIRTEQARRAKQSQPKPQLQAAE